MHNPLTSYFFSGDTIRSRSVGDAVHFGVLEVPVPSAQLIADWERDVLRLGLEPGDVEELPLARTRARWSDYRRCVHAMDMWVRGLGLPDLLADSSIALMACRGAKYHHDGAQYGSAVFCNLFLSEDKDLDLHFSCTGQRIPLSRGTAVIFDTGQPHAVIRRSGMGFNGTDFAPAEDCTQVFLSWELSIDDAKVASLLGITLDVDSATASQLTEAQVWCNGAAALVCPHTGQLT